MLARDLSLRGMARKLGVQYPGALYHVMNRGDHQEDIFRGDEDRELFIETLGEACEGVSEGVSPIIMTVPA